MRNADNQRKNAVDRRQGVKQGETPSHLLPTPLYGLEEDCLQVVKKFAIITVVLYIVLHYYPDILKSIH